MACFDLLAYIDPASGTILLQLLLAGLVGSAAFLRGHIARAVGWALGRRGAEAAAEADETDDAHEDRYEQRREAA